jgi:hypothetical protein
MHLCPSRENGNPVFTRRREVMTGECLRNSSIAVVKKRFPVFHRNKLGAVRHLFTAAVKRTSCIPNILHASSLTYKIFLLP